MDTSRTHGNYVKLMNCAFNQCAHHDVFATAMCLPSVSWKLQFCRPKFANVVQLMIFMFLLHCLKDRWNSAGFFSKNDEIQRIYFISDDFSFWGEQDLDFKSFVVLDSFGWSHRHSSPFLAIPRHSSPSTCSPFLAIPRHSSPFPALESIPNAIKMSKKQKSNNL